MSVWVLLLLCVIQGLTEFLPVSSSGHLLFCEQIFNINDNLLLLNLFLHLASLLAVIVVYRKVLLSLLKRPFQPLIYKLALSTIITLVFAAIYKVFNIDSIVKEFYGICFLITAGLLFAVHKFKQKSAVIKTQTLTYKEALFVGLVQGFAVLPGISRSGSTISAMLLMGNSEGEASQYSFLLSIPIIIGGFIVELASAKNLTEMVTGSSWWIYIIAFALTFVVAFAALKLTVKLFKENKYTWLAGYLLCLGLVVTIYNFCI